jgi:hypothetical protein
VGESVPGNTVGTGVGAGVSDDSTLTLSPFPLVPDDVDPGFLFGGGFFPPDGFTKLGFSSLNVGFLVGSLVSVAFASVSFASGLYGSYPMKSPMSKVDVSLPELEPVGVGAELSGGQSGLHTASSLLRRGDDGDYEMKTQRISIG